MLHKIIDKFDIDTYGWFDQETFGPKREHDFSHILLHCEDIWSLWIQRPTQFLFEHNSGYRSPLNIAHYIHNEVLLSNDSWVDRKIRTGHITETEFMKRFTHLATTSGMERVNDPMAYMCHLSFADYLTSVTDPKKPDVIHIPSAFLSNEVGKRVGDHYILADATAAWGLEATRITHLAFNNGNIHNLKVLGQLANDIRLPARTVNNTQLKAKEHVIADCSIDIFNALCTAQARSEILTRWPGWSEIFSAKDEVCIGTKDKMDSAVSRASKDRSELRRFCMALAWNINAPPNQRVKFPKSMSTQYNNAIHLWANMVAPHLQTPALTPEHINNLVCTLALTLSCDETYSPNSRLPSSGSDLSAMDAHQVERSKLRTRRNFAHADVSVQPRKISNTEFDADECTLTTPPAAAFFMPCSWDRLNAHDKPDRDYIRTSVQFMDKVRENIASQVSASSWFVPQPPPLEPGHLNGRLDESSLTDFVAFRDHSIFCNSPELGHGDIVMCVLVDGSGSMSSHYITHPTEEEMQRGSRVRCDPQCYMQEATAFLSGLKDGLARHSNVHVMSFVFDSSCAPRAYDNQPTVYNPPEFIDASIPICRMVPITNEADFTHIPPRGGTPTATAIHNAHHYMEQLHPNATRIIVVLTDGAPCGTVSSIYDAPTEDRVVASFHESPAEVRTVIKSISTPVFCVGYGVSNDLLSKQYNPDCFVCVDRPLDAVEVTCNLIAQIGQSISR